MPISFRELDFKLTEKPRPAACQRRAAPVAIETLRGVSPRCLPMPLAHRCGQNAVFGNLDRSGLRQGV